jgi:hypothetical protein
MGGPIMETKRGILGRGKDIEKVGSLTQAQAFYSICKLTKLARWAFINAEKRHITIALEKKDIITVSSISFMFTVFHLSS